MEDDMATNAFFIEAYFRDLENRVTFLEELNRTGHRNEALLLCCCYIEALGSRQSSEPKSKAKNYCSILVQYGENEIWSMLHPKQIQAVLSEKKLFNNAFRTVEPLIDAIGNQLISPLELLGILMPSLNAAQQRWLQENIYKGSMANISYEHIRSALVHDISASDISFSATQYKGNPLPNIDWDLLYPSLQKIVATLKNEALLTGKWWWEQPT